MFTVAVLAQKGGVGKTTLVLSLASQAQLARARSGVVDADPQATASSWFLTRQHAGKEAPVVAAAPDAKQLKEAVADAKSDGFDWLFIDTPAGVSELPATAAALADLVLLPCGPSRFDMDAMAPTVKLIKNIGKSGSSFFLVNKGRSKGINDECAVALTSAYGLPAANTHISHRLPIADASAEGLTLPELKGRDTSIEKGRDEFRALWAWLNKQKQAG
jgi:chromosome partitioning protein